MKKYYKLYNPNPSAYANKHTADKGKANIHYEHQPENPYDSEAIMVFTFKKNGDREDLGFIQKRQFVGHEYSEAFLTEFNKWESKAAYGLYEDRDENILEDWMTYVPGKTWYYKNEWNGERMSNKYEMLFEEGELDQLLSDIAAGEMRYHFDYDWRVICKRS